ncbi:MAG: hypothetical protein R3225_05870 [Halofilum sp. (in: g-proteobacteria)]|nr:hypothetical protein [Halofilum sp. (in: g-proteobacteria)]
MTVAVVIGTRKGLFVARSDDRDAWALDGPHIAGYEIQSAWLDPRDPRTGYAAAHHPVWGVHVYRSGDGGRSWRPLAEIPRHGEGEDESSIRTLWCLAPGADTEPDTLYAGIEPPGLFVSRDRGEHWQRLPALDRHETAHLWHPARGGLALHSIHVDPADPARIYCALCAGGCYRSDDAGASWRPINAGVRAPYLPDPCPVAGQNEHRLLMHPAAPERLYRQSHTGTWRSDDGGEHWSEITAGLPSDFGYALATDRARADTLFVIPEAGTQMRYPVDGRLRVYRTEDAGARWEALTEGLPQAHVYATVLRDGLDSDHLEPLGLYFGTSSGHLFRSADRGDSWQRLAEFLPAVLTVKACAGAP